MGLICLVEHARCVKPFMKAARFSRKLFEKIVRKCCQCLPLTPNPSVGRKGMLHQKTKQTGLLVSSEFELKLYFIMCLGEIISGCLEKL